MPITCGVPQGSILGPLLFLVYVNNIYKASQKLMHVMFGDDTNLFFSHKDINVLFSTMQNELENISTWFKANKLSLNINKTKWSPFHSSSKRKHILDILPILTIDNTIIHRDKVTKFLGILIDENLSWKYHIDAVNKKNSKTIGILYNARQFLNKHNLKLLYFAFVQSYLNYGIIAYGSTHKSKLQGLYCHQKHAARVINFKNRYTHADPLLREIKALSVYGLNIFATLCLMYKCKKNHVQLF